MDTITLTFQEGTSSKFYTLKREDKVLKINFGKIGSNGQTQLKEFKNAADAAKEYEKLLAEKRKKGYVDQGGATAAPATKGAAATKAAAPKATAVKGAAAEAVAKTNGKNGHSEAAPASAAAKASSAAKVLKAVPAPATSKGKAPALPQPALEDPPVPGLDSAIWRQGNVPVPERDPTPFPSGDFVIEGYTLSFGDDEEVVVTDPKGKKLKSVPDKLRKNEDYQSLMRGRKDDRARERRARRVLEERMISGTPLMAEEIGWLVEDDAFAPLLKGLVVHPEGRPKESGILMSWDKDRGLGVLPLDYDARWIGWQNAELIHPMKLGDVIVWQDLLVDLGLQQALVQAFREVKNVPLAQRKLTESSMLSGRETSSGSAIERTLMEEGWVARRGMARRKMSVRTPEGVIAVEAWFDYGEYYMPGDPTTSGSFGFFAVGSSKPLKFNEVPDVLVSEAIRSLDLCLTQAGAKKDEDEEQEEGAEGENAEASSEDDGDGDE